jgi:hypothetical protein
LQVFPIGGPVGDEIADREISRPIQIRGDQTLADLHRAIFDAFDREEEHLYEFHFGQGHHDPEGPRQALHPGRAAGMRGGILAGDVETTTLDDLGLEVGRAFGHRFDFGRDRMHQIDVEAIDEAPARVRFPGVIARVGASPPQYPPEGEEVSMVGAGARGAERA